MNNGVNNSDTNQVTQTQEPVLQPMSNDTKPKKQEEQREQIEAAKVYKLEKAPEEVEETPKVEQPVIEQPQVQQPAVVKPKRKKNILATLLFMIVLGLLGYIFYTTVTFKATIDSIRANSTPVSTLKEEKELELDSYFVQDLYSKVKTNILEDVAESEMNNSLMLYLAYRQIPNSKFYEADCENFDSSLMMPYTCDVGGDFVPQGFKKDDLISEYKKLFGANAEVELDNIQIGRNCVGGYQYVAKTGEFIQGYCTSKNTTTYKASKKLVSATSKESTITLKEDVVYKTNGTTLPDSLKSGTYVYVFRLDKNYNYVLVNKYLEGKE